MLSASKRNSKSHARPYGVHIVPGEGREDRSADPSFSGGELKRPTFIGEDEVFIRTLIAYTHGTRDMTEDEFYSNRSLLKYHIDSGAALLEQCQESGRSADALLRRLVSEVEFSGRREGLGTGLDIFVGRTLLQKADVIMELNNTAKHANSHLAIMGKPGVGKTQFLLKILADIRGQSSFQTNFIYFDYKGDVQAMLASSKSRRSSPFACCKEGKTCPSIRLFCPLMTIKQSCCLRVRRRRVSPLSTASWVWSRRRVDRGDPRSLRLNGQA